jgi:hypothetical protein
MSLVLLLIKSTMPAFCRGATRQQMTTLHEVAKSNNCETESSKKLMNNEGATNKLQFDICICRYFLCIEE